MFVMIVSGAGLPVSATDILLVYMIAMYVQIQTKV